MINIDKINSVLFPEFILGTFPQIYTLLFVMNRRRFLNSRFSRFLRFYIHSPVRTCNYTDVVTTA